MMQKPAAVFLDHATIGPDVRLTSIEALVDITCYDYTAPEDVVERIGNAEIVVANKTRIERHAIERLPRTRLIVLTATGTDNVDSNAAAQRRIALANVRSYCNASVVQHVFALILGLTQQAHRYDELVRRGRWQASRTFALFDYPIRELAGLNLGIVGYGSLGRSVAELGRCLGMKLLISGRPGADAAPPGRVAFADVLAGADVVSLHCPLTSATRHLLDAAAFTRMRNDAILINTARGGLVDGAALVAALEAGDIAGAGIDVLETEPPDPDDPLLHAGLANLLVTPHIAWATREARQRAVDQAAENIAAFLDGKQLRRVV
ncbi:MAG TPA: D-2-hydroxyacid dehydrogenase [Gammaproteobacteria bacterium]|nr:D-2-hydroxyacid dehydrogenase [Gammaproteobacteria bacterium]